MTKNTKASANNAATHADARSDIGDAISVAMRGNVQSTNAIARIAADLCQLIATSNGEASFTIRDDKSPVDVPFNTETLGRYARKTLPSKARDATDEAPTSSQMITALSQTSDAVRNAVDSMAAEKAAQKKAKGNPIVAMRHEAEAERLSQSLNTLKAPIRRAMMLAAYVMVNNAYDAKTARVADGKMLVAIDTGKTDKNGATVYEEIAVTYSRANEFFSDDTSRAPNSQGGTSNGAENAPDPTTDGSKVSATFTPQAVRKGGADRAKLADSIKLIAGLLTDMETKPTMQEREAIQRLWVACGSLLDDDAILEASAMADKTGTDDE